VTTSKHKEHQHVAVIAAHLQRTLSWVSPIPTGGFAGLSPPNKAPSPPH